MPSAIPSPSGFTLRPWRISKQSRHTSTGLDLMNIQSDNRMAAMLHRKKGNDAGNDASKRPSSKHAASQPASQQSTAPSRRSAQKSTQSQQASKAAHKQIQSRQPRTLNKTRKAPKLKDEAYIRSTMHIPRPDDYPTLRKDLFKNPRTCILNIGLGHCMAECRTEFTALSKDAFQCTAYYDSAMHSEAVVGEGRTKASHSVSGGRVC